MKTLAPAVTQAIAGQEIWPVRFVDLQVGGTTYHLSDHYKTISVGSNTYLPNGSLLSISDIESRVQAGDQSVEIALSGIDTNFRLDVLNSDILGGTVTIKRGLINHSTGALVADPITVFQGIVFQVASSDEYPTDLSSTGFGSTAFTVTVEVRSLVYKLEESPGRATNNASNHEVDPTDMSMEFVASLNGKNIRFGGSPDG